MLENNARTRHSVPRNNRDFEWLRGIEFSDANRLDNARVVATRATEIQ